MMTNKKCFGIDLGGTTTKIGLFDIEGDKLETYEIPTDKREKGKYILDNIVKFLNQIISEKKIDKNDILGIGIGVPGAVTEDGIVNKCINLGWGVLPIQQILREKTGLPVKAGNDANMAALGEYWKGGSNQVSSMVLVTLGTGIGGGIIIKGKPFHGFHGAAAEIGHMPLVREETQKCNCGKTGCLEQAASATGVVRTAKRILEETDIESKLRNMQDITARDVFELAKNEDPGALVIVDFVTEYLGSALANVAAVIDPECFVIGGGVSRAGKFLTDKIQQSFQRNVFHPSKDTQILLAELGNDAGMYGAAKLLIDAEQIWE